MTPPELNRIYLGDALAVMKTWPDGFIQTVVTSPPYWGLRDYGTATWEGGEAGCGHRVGNQVQDNKATGAITAGVRPGVDASVCLACGASRTDSQLGLEPTPESYVAKMVEVFREVRRVLRDDGTLWLNLGDSYANNASTSELARSEQGNGSGAYQIPPEKHHQVRRAKPNRLTEMKGSGLKHKDLVGIPWRVAFALQADGWYLRSDIIWAKPNPMPESVTDRPTKAHEYLFLMAKSERYYYDAEAIREPFSPHTLVAYPNGPGGNRYPLGVPGQAPHSGLSAAMPNDGRNKRSVWTIATMPYAEAHFATFPPDLIKPCILAGSKAGDIVFDLFMGAGTTALVAAHYNRRFLGIELNPAYVTMAEARIANETAQLKMVI